MLFTESIFLFLFLPVFLLFFRLFSSKNGHFNNGLKIITIIGTIIFYVWHYPLWLIPFCIAVIFDFFWSYLLARTENPKSRKLILIASITQNLLLFFVFKYLTSIISSELFDSIPFINMLEEKLTKHNGKPLISMPAGISFYLFESMSYVIDVYRKKFLPPKNPLDFFVFIAMFPRFIAGPIVRYADIKDQIFNWQKGSFNLGLTIFMIGFIYKSLLADNFVLFERYAFSEYTTDFVSAWVGSLAYTFQLYFDFAGYSLMAIGLGKCMGFQFNKNFNNPYISESMTEFWRRWHMTLSNWLRDYLYISLGGNRCSPIRHYFNLFFTMFVAGIWHGANLTFVVWGSLQGIYMVIEKIFDNKLNKIPKFIRQLFTFSLIVLGWIIFRSDNLTQAKNILLSALGFHGFANIFNFDWIAMNPFSFSLSIIGIIYCFLISPQFAVPLEDKKSFSFQIQLLILFLFFISLALTFRSKVVPFLYFQF